MISRACLALGVLNIYIYIEYTVYICDLKTQYIYIYIYTYIMNQEHVNMYITGSGSKLEGSTLDPMMIILSIGIILSFLRSIKFKPPLDVKQPFTNMPF